MQFLCTEAPTEKYPLKVVVLNFKNVRKGNF